jgi:hypothetical protein
MRFNELPEAIQSEAKAILECYDDVHVLYEYGKYEVTIGIAITKTYAPDHEYIGKYTAKEVYTDNERMINYLKSFREYPIEYKGKRDYQALRKMNNASTIELVEGNLIIK